VYVWLRSTDLTKYPALSLGVENTTGKLADRQNTANVEATFLEVERQTNTGQLPDLATTRIAASGDMRR